VKRQGLVQLNPRGSRILVTKTSKGKELRGRTRCAFRVPKRQSDARKNQLALTKARCRLNKQKRIVAPVLVGQSFSPEDRLSHIARREAQALSRVPLRQPWAADRVLELPPSPSRSRLNRRVQGLLATVFYFWQQMTYIGVINLSSLTRTSVVSKLCRSFNLRWVP
jgi:hypothetical protein